MLIENLLRDRSLLGAEGTKWNKTDKSSCYQRVNRPVVNSAIKQVNVIIMGVNLGEIQNVTGLWRKEIIKCNVS